MAEHTYFPLNADAATLHAEGLRAELAGDFDTAHYQFGQAIAALGEETGINLYDRARLFQQALIDRDDAFTYVREGIAEGSEGQIDTGKQLLKHCITDLSAIKSEAGLYLPKKDGGRLISELGQTMGLLARAVTVEAVLDGEVETIPLEDYSEAFQLLRSGTNRYFATNHAMTAARAELVARGRSPKVAQWVGVAMITGSKALLNDAGNAWAVSRTMVGRLPDLRSEAAATAAILKRP